jgi:hypothetical protein
MIPQLVSLVKYDNPTLVSTTKDKRSKDKSAKKVRAASQPTTSPTLVILSQSFQNLRSRDLLNILSLPSECTTGCLSDRVSQAASSYFPARPSSAPLAVH